jgi:Protein of unknown function (DUF2934)
MCGRDIRTARHCAKALETVSEFFYWDNVLRKKQDGAIMAKATKKKRDNGGSPLSDQSPVTTVSDEKIRARIAEQAYQLYQQRSCIPGHDAEDWLEAEGLILAELSAQAKKPSKSPGRRKNQQAAKSRASEALAE